MQKQVNWSRIGFDFGDFGFGFIAFIALIAFIGFFGFIRVIFCVLFTCLLWIFPRFQFPIRNVRPPRFPGCQKRCMLGPLTGPITTNFLFESN
jgi:hypothetical protein